MYSLLSILIIIPLIPIIIWSATGAITTAIIIALGISFWKGRKQIYMSVLGMQSAGKTTWYDYLRGENRASEGATSGGVEISEFTITYKDNKDTRELTIAKGLDIDGTEDSIREFYKAQIEKSDVVFFFFDINKYLEIEEYQRVVNSRLDFIYDLIKENDKNLDDVYLIATHLRKVEDAKKALKKVRNILSEKRYKVFTKQLSGIEMQNKEEMEKLKIKLIENTK